MGEAIVGLKICFEISELSLQDFNHFLLTDNWFSKTVSPQSVQQLSFIIFVIIVFVSACYNSNRIDLHFSTLKKYIRVLDKVW